MFEICAVPTSIEGLTWLSCYLTSGKHLDFYMSFGIVLSLLAVTAPAAMLLGFGGAMAARSQSLLLRILGKSYSGMVRGVPDIVFFLFFVISLDQGFEYVKSRFVCADLSASVYQGLEFHVCDAAKVPLATASPLTYQLYGFSLAVLTFAIVYGAFVAHVIYGAMQAVPRAQLETAEAYGMSHRQVFRRILVPQMWTYALPGLTNLWMVLIKSTPLLFLLSVKDIVYYARELGSTKTTAYAYPHADWRIYYFLVLLVFYLLMTKVSEVVLGKLSARLSKGQATAAGENQRRAAV
jgi:polar amino acid transport system permease protein